MKAQECADFIRTISGEPVNSQRWNDKQLLSFIDRAQKMVVRNVLWPESRLTFQTAPGVQEYQLPEVLRILRVYVQGQQLPRTDIATLGGEQIEQFDQSGTSGGPGGQYVPFAAPSLVTGSYTPAWTGQTAGPYPVATAIDFPAAPNSPWIVGRRPVYYCDGGNIGFVQAPSTVMPVQLTVVRNPYTLSNLTNDMVLPDIALDAVAWKAVELMMFGDKGTDNAQDQRNYAQTEYAKALAELRTWKRRYSGRGSRSPKFLPTRSFYTQGARRAGSDD